MAETIREKKVKTRKKHTCFSCSRKIETGEKAELMVIAGTDDGICTLYECSDCTEYKEKYCKHCEGNINGFYCYDDHDGCYWEDYIAECRNYSGRLRED